MRSSRAGKKRALEPNDFFEEPVYADDSEDAEEAGGLVDEADNEADGEESEDEEELRTDGAFDDHLDRISADLFERKLQVWTRARTPTTLTLLSPV